MNIQPFKQTSKKDVHSVGGKGASLGELTNVGFPIPPGFTITTAAYKTFAHKSTPQDFVDELYVAFDQLGNNLVAVRSSAITEDSTTTSWAGQLESYLNVTKETLLDSVKKCWNSINSQKATAYAKQYNLDPNQLAVAVVIQKMIASDISGVMFTINPVTNNKNQIIIEAIYGLGELLVQGSVTPDNYLVNKQTLLTTNSKIGNQNVLLTYQNSKNKTLLLPKKLKNKFALGAKQIKEIAKLGVKIETYFKSPQDIEWALEDNKLYILQSRPITA